jgi:hypothetical protein
MFNSPVKLAFGGIAAWLVVWLLTPVDVVGELALGAVIYAIIGYAALIFGAIMAWRPELEAEAAVVSNPWNKPLVPMLFWSTMALGLFGIALRLFDRLFLRGIDYAGMNAFELREALSASSSSPAGIVAAIMLPLCLIPLMLLLASRDRTSKPLLAIAGLVFLLPMAESLFQLSRSYLLLTLGLGFATIVITRFGGTPFHRKLILLSVAGVLAILALSTVIFSARLEAGSGRLADSVFDSVYANYLQPSAAAQRTISTGSDTAAFVTLAVLPNGMYYISGAYEFSALWTRPDGQQFAYGQMLLFPFVRVIHYVMGSDGLSQERVENYVYRDGVFQTFFGPLWVDFGWIGPFLLVPFGYLVQLLSYRVRTGSTAFLPIYIYLAIVIFFMPVVNFMVNGFGMLSITAFVIFAVYAARVDARPLTQAEEA